jgi:hypothetical protein
VRRRKIGFFGLPELESARRAVEELKRGQDQSAADAGAAADIGPSFRNRIAGSLFGVLGAGFILLGTYAAAEAYRSASWPTAPATVTFARIRVQRGRHPSYSPDVHYRYALAGRTYEASRVAFGSLAGSRSRAAAIVARYPEGSIVAASYDPHDPRRSVLQPGPNPGIWWMPGFGAFFALAGILVGCAPARRLK